MNSHVVLIEVRTSPISVDASNYTIRNDESVLGGVQFSIRRSRARPEII